jgi:dolichol kinase
MVVLIAEALPSREHRIAITVLAVVVAWGIELARVLIPRGREVWSRLFGAIARPHEVYHVTSGTWYVTSLVLLSTLFPLDAGVVGIAVLGVGDPAAAVVGRRLGRIRTVGARTLEGSLAFVGFGFLAGWLTLGLWHAEAGQLAALAAAAAVAGAGGELISGGRLDDNLVIPLLAATAMVVARGMGV